MDPSVHMPSLSRARNTLHKIEEVFDPEEAADLIIIHTVACPLVDIGGCSDLLGLGLESVSSSQ